MDLYSIITGILIGCIIGVILCKSYKPDGAFIINMTDPEKDVFRLEMWRPFEGLQNERSLYFKVIVEGDSRDLQRP